MLSRINKQLDQWRSRKIFALDLVQVKSVVLRDEGQELVVAKEDKDWKVIKPLAIEADDLKVKEYLSALNAAEIQSFLPQEKGQAVEAGLTSAKLSLRIQDNQEKLKILWIGNLMPDMEGHYYAKIEGQDLVFTVTEGFVRSVRDLLDKVRDRHVFPLVNVADVMNVKLETKGQVTFELKRDKEEPSRWWVQNLGQMAGGLEVRALLESLKRLKGLEFGEPGLGEGVEPEFVLSLSIRNGDEMTETEVHFGVEKDLLLRVWNKAMPYSMTISADFVDEGLQKKSWDFLETQVIERGHEQWNSVTWKINGSETKVIREGRDWVHETEEIDQGLMVQIVEILENLQAVRWEGQVDDKDFENVGTEVVITLKDGDKIVLRISQNMPGDMALCSLKGNPFTFLISNDTRKALQTLPFKKGSK